MSRNLGFLVSSGMYMGIARGLKLQGSPGYGEILPETCQKCALGQK